MPIDFTFMVGGEAGQGVQSVGMILARVMSRGGFNVFADQDYESRIRGGHNSFRIRASNRKILALSEYLDILIALNRETVELHESELKSGGVIIFDGEQAKVEGKKAGYIDVPLVRLAEDVAQNRLMTNTVAAGAAIGLSGVDFKLLEVVLRDEFAKAGEKIVAGNIAAAKAGFEYVLKPGTQKFTHKLKPAGKSHTQMLLHGNEAIALGAMVAGCKFIAGYPMTPATSILEYMANKSTRYNVVAMHVEDEISAINMTVGAAFAGVRAMTVTSGGGFSLMVEGLALAGMTETPIVVVLAQRPGPATGLPTRTEQGELEFALHAGHGEFPRAVLAPATAEEAFYATIKAFNLAEKYQTPVIILTDHHLATSYTTVDKFDLKKVKIERGAMLSDEEANTIADYKRHQVTDSGVSPRAFPLQGKALVVTDSDEHDESGHMIEDAETRLQQNLKRLRKLNGLKTEITPPLFHQVPDAEVTLVGWGSTYGDLREAAEILEKDGVKANTMHISQIWPFPVKEVTSALDNNTRHIAIENNATGQMARLIRRETGYKIDKSILKCDGRPFSPLYIIEQLKKEVSSLW